MYCPGTAPRFTDDQNFATPGSLWNFGLGANFRVIGYATTFGANILAATNRNSTILPQPVTVGPLLAPSQPASQRVLTADANLSQDGANFTQIPGGFAFNGLAYPHICPHLDGLVPAGGNVGMLDGHVEWRPFSQMKIRTTAGSQPFFYW
jgi:prepilin-type processing-associated H-X9-DG protein